MLGVTCFKTNTVACSSRSGGCSRARKPRSEARRLTRRFNYLFGSPLSSLSGKQHALVSPASSPFIVGDDCSSVCHNFLSHSSHGLIPPPKHIHTHTNKGACGGVWCALELLLHHRRGHYFVTNHTGGPGSPGSACCNSNVRASDSIVPW